MGFTLRLTLEIILLLSSCYISNCTVSGRHTRQIPPPEVSSLEDTNYQVNGSLIDDIKKITKNEVVTEKKPKTENITEKIYINKNVDSKYKDRSKLTNDDVTKRNDEEGRSESGRSIDISKYVSEDFHNKNNVYTVPDSPDTEKYTNYENVLPEYDSTAKLEVTTKYDFDKTYQKIENGVNQKLQYIDKKFAHRDYEFKEPQPDVSEILKQARNNNTQVFNYSKFKNLTSNANEEKNKSHKELEVSSGQNLDFKSSYRNTQLLGGNNRNPANNEVINSTEKAAIVRSTEPSDFDTLKDNPSSKKAVIRNESEIQKSLLSNKIESDTSSLPKWSYVLPSTRIQVSVTTSSPTTKRGQEENAIFVPYLNDSINITKRGSTKYSDTTSSSPFVLPNKHNLKKLNLADKENATLEQSVQENQVYPVQIPAPDRNQNTTEKNIETSTVPLKLFTSLPNITESIQSTIFENKTDSTTESLTSAQTFATTSGDETTSSLETATPEAGTRFTTTPVVTEGIFSTTQRESTTKSSEEDYSYHTTGSEEYLTSEERTVSSGTTSHGFEETEFTSEDYQADQRTSGRDFKSSYEPTFTGDEGEEKTTFAVETTSTEMTENSLTSSNTNQQIVLSNETDTKTTTTEWFRTTESKEVGTDEPQPSVYTTVPAQREIKPNPYETTTEDKPLIIPLNISNGEPDHSDATTESLESESREGDVEEEETSAGKIAAIVISCIGAICLIILAGLLIIMRKRHKRFNYGQRCTPVSLDAYSVDNVSVHNSVRRKAAMRASKRSYGNPAFDDPSLTSNPLNFPALAKFSNNSEAIVKEFEEIPQVTAQTSELPDGCDSKNRYANVIPLPETRVFLSSVDGYPNSDYINANYVTGPKSAKRYYIACQAPILNTVDDFWKMVWEQQSKVILMLTHLFENGSEKCVDYLPPSEVLDCHRLFGDYHVTLKKREVKEKYVISSLHLKNMVSNSWREITHLWYLGWPEKGVPSEANSLIAFLIEARSYIKAIPSSENGKTLETTSIANGSITPDQSPVIVHCSPGTGRTGTVIACDIAIREFELTRQVDIPKTVYRIRRDRASAVQTKEQYGFIYNVITLYATKLTGGVLDDL